jgi:uncharacterized cupredoxin-like copper-binding protein
MRGIDLRRPLITGLLGGLLLVLAACSSGVPPLTSDAAKPSPSAVMPMASGDAMESFAWGMPAAAADADRVIEVQMLDQLRFEPSSIDVKVGETVTFKVLNSGKITHDFTLGDEEMQDEHEAEMAAGMPSTGHDEPNQMSIEPGSEGELTWRFTEATTVLYGCHVTGHYGAGMVGTITVAGS